MEMQKDLVINSSDSSESHEDKIFQTGTNQTSLNQNKKTVKTLT